MKVIFDTSFIVYVLEKPTDVLNQIVDQLGMPEIVVPKSVIRELRGISMSKKFVRNFTALRMQVVEDMDDGADNDILELCKKTGYPVFTLDGELMKRLSDLALPCYTVFDERLTSCGSRRKR
ncbi:MAG: hypothetical protein ACP5GH_00820 [Nitrososphaeria archaeon]